jgi:hypothetical protein
MAVLSPAPRLALFLLGLAGWLLILRRCTLCGRASQTTTISAGWLDRIKLDAVVAASLEQTNISLKTLCVLLSARLDRASHHAGLAQRTRMSMGLMYMLGQNPS